MDLSIRDKNVKKAEKEMIICFCERNMSNFANKTPEEIILAWLDYQYARYKVNESEDGFYINDYENKEIIAFISKADPRAYAHAHDLCDELNDPIQAPFVSIDGREIQIPNPDFCVELKDNDLVDFLINELEKEDD